MEYLNTNDWKQLFEATMCEDFPKQHPSFYEDLSWEEENNEKNCALALDFILSKDPANLKVIWEEANSDDSSDFYCEQVLSGKFEVEVIFETELVLSFHHSKPYFEHHVVIIPKKHIDSLSSSDAIDSALAKDFLMAIHHVSSKLEKLTGGCRVSSNVGNYQTSKHLHWYVHSGERLRNEDGSVIHK